MNFIARLRKQSESLIITIPNEVVSALKLKFDELAQFDIKVLVSQDSTPESKENAVKNDSSE